MVHVQAYIKHVQEKTCSQDFLSNRIKFWVAHDRSIEYYMDVLGSLQFQSILSKTTSDWQTQRTIILRRVLHFEALEEIIFNKVAIGR